MPYAMLKSLSIILVFTLFGGVLSAQTADPNLANQYFSDGEFEKAAALYAQLVEKERRSDYYFTRYIECLTKLEKWDDAEKAVKKQIKEQPENNVLFVVYGQIFEEQGKNTEAETQYQKAIDKMASDYAAVIRLANMFQNESKYDYAVKTYERGAQLTRDPNRFAYNLGDLYRRKGEPVKMTEQYLNALESDPGKLPSLQTIFARTLGPEDLQELQTQLYARIQQNENPDYIELLAWSFVQRKDFKSALRQYKALDKRLGESGQRVMRLADDAAEAKDYETAIAAYEYVMTEKGQTSPFFYDAKREAMQCRRRKITEGFQYTQQDLTLLEAEYEQFLSQYGKTKLSAGIIMQLADLEAIYMRNLPKAIQLLEDLKQTPGLPPDLVARLKLNLGDFYLMDGDIWESTLLYSQVDKAYKEDTIGQEARFKNARLSYFNGDFQWAQAQFDVLKASTSKMIANDALDLSVFIMDNLNLDTTSDAISLYASAEMLVLQNRFDEAFLKLDTLARDFPEHSLQDDILYLKARIWEKQRDYQKAIPLYEEVAEKYKDDIRADNSLFALAQIYEFRMNDTEKAKGIYEKIFLDYSGSVFAVDARKRFRILRGDKVQ
ncbi:MAG TPA: tetratricopeptide repeat protein [Saprospiraceae bacterium]|nr:tetratricopeptide repeat protein [Saprospiraceae bacterium]